MNSGYIYLCSPSGVDAYISWAFLLLQLSVIGTNQSAHPSPPIWGLSQYSILSIDALLPFDSGHRILDGLLLKHFFTQLEMTKWKGWGRNAPCQLSSKHVAIDKIQPVKVCIEGAGSFPKLCLLLMHNCKSQYPITTDSKQSCFST